MRFSNVALSANKADVWRVFLNIRKHEENFFRFSVHFFLANRDNIGYSIGVKGKGNAQAETQNAHGG